MLHPEELLERDPSELSARERELVDAHLASCVACRVLYAARGDFAAERTELEAGERASDVSRRVAGEIRPVEPRRARRAIGWMRLPLVAALVLAASAAAATGLGLFRSAPRREPVQATTPLAMPSVAAAVRKLSTHGRTLPKPAPASPADDALEPETQNGPSSVAAPDPLERGLRPAPERVASVTATATVRSASAVAKTTEAPRTANAPAEPPRPTVSEASSLFERARGARQRGDYSAALADYRELEQRFPSSEEARASRAIVARILLDTGKNQAALAGYDRYLADPSAPLGEEAWVGRALAEARLGNVAGERAAWQELLRRYPSSVHATRARARLAATRDVR